MPTKTTTTNNSSQNSIFNPASMAQYNSFQGSGGNVLQQDVQNPMSQIGFNQRLQMGNQNLFNMFQQRNSQIGNQMGAWGGNTPGFLQNQLNNNARGLTGMQAGMFNQNMLYADQLRQGAAQQMLSYRPLQTGSNSTSTSTQSTGGVGAWLSPIMSAGLGIATGGMSSLLGGGMKSLFGGGGGGFFGGAGNGPMDPSMNNSGSGMQNTNYDPLAGQMPSSAWGGQMQSSPWLGNG